jgi:hypothetical protein
MSSEGASWLNSTLWISFTASRFLLAFLGARCLRRDAGAEDAGGRDARAEDVERGERPSPLRAGRCSDPRLLSGDSIAGARSRERSLCPQLGLLIGSHALALAAIGAYLAAPASRAALWTMVVVFGASSAVWFPNGLALGRKLVPRLSGLAQACFELSANAGNGAVPFFAGWAAPWLGRALPGVPTSSAGVMITSAASVLIMQAILTWMCSLGRARAGARPAGPGQLAA